MLQEQKRPELLLAAGCYICSKCMSNPSVMVILQALRSLSGSLSLIGREAPVQHFFRTPRMWACSFLFTLGSANKPAGPSSL